MIVILLNIVFLLLLYRVIFNLLNTQYSLTHGSDYLTAHTYFLNLFPRLLKSSRGFFLLAIQYK